MKTYAVWQKSGYCVLRTTNKKEADKKLAEMNEYCKNKDGYYICEQGYDDK